MKEIELQAKHKVIALHAVKNCPDGFKGIDRIRSGLRLLKKLEKDIPQDVKLSEEELERVHSVKLELEEYSLLKTCLDSQPWTGMALELVDGLYSKLDEAKEE